MLRVDAHGKFNLRTGRGNRLGFFSEPITVALSFPIQKLHHKPPIDENPIPLKLKPMGPKPLTHPLIQDSDADLLKDTKHRLPYFLQLIETKKR